MTASNAASASTDRRSRPSPAIHSDNYRIYLVVRQGAGIGFLAHLAFIPLFSLLKIYPLALFNVLSVLAWGYAYWVNNNARHGLAIHVIGIEVVLHAALATWLLGWDAGFGHYLVTLIVFAMFNHQIANRWVVAEALFIVFLYAGMFALTHGKAIYSMSQATIQSLNMINAVISFSTLALISYFFREGSIYNERSMERLANTDPLTQLPNRRYLWKQLEAEVLRTTDGGAPFALVLADLDGFKRINDQYGHEVGDQVLTEVARRMRSCLRENDVVGRWGGEEFLILMPQMSANDAFQAAERVRRAVAESPMETSVGALSLTISLGVAHHRPGIDLGETIHRADTAMYRAKMGGRNRVEPEQ
ncbi:GGDEF domain-containing protein [Permianibacter aggregans]|uniref:diguanylate cyclase n=1 Tax=Permianibacter aggregans TaxID=1510150 RepID=A0A4R6UC27_9GAMM|nr:GGDEF domain-containing protein [Permianibacter aggregans]QGX40322.1 GGDEF domain-containing protein [Permianibacter aggregans]TDQ44240.1 diguanylate cyclase (GGDEF)-like protein [Permianibacter aggregans]